MKILLSTDTVGGVWDYTVTLARELDAAGHEVLVAVIGEPRDERLAVLPAGVQVVWRQYRLEWMADAAGDVEAAGEWLRGLAEVWSADIVHLNQIAYAVHDFPAPVLVVVHSDVLSWWTHVLGVDAPAEEWKGYGEWMRAGMAAADALVTPTVYQAEMVTRHYGVPVTRVIHNGTHLTAGEPAPREGSMVLSVGRVWDRGKGVDVLDEAARLLGDDAPEIHVIGEPEAPHGEAYHPKYVTAHGRVERAQVDDWMRRAAIYCAPSRYEPFGLAPLEAALHGCALVLSDIGTFRELWDGCAEFFPPGDAEALARTLRALADDPARRARCAGAARKRAERRYTATRMAADYIELYQQLLRGPAARRRGVNRLATSS
ncbi:glycosyltransferase family 4 protein [Longimicrobium terrae]|uniref:Glycosyltransferase involved in cell wall biosynthesis n=1 Tax=Longimicrobium terrae TaxID=1639882 RepID=A0A841GNS7_9BACT|nr:glycosyltransferase family 4 protein [Longimicrobium terrae]MBB4634570.1 glycosyltransferase involved in cell wall biosynthesis [Longimicrobium terrae]MBB6068540.1 glycosyltransferase involved in cell wall biosynthesis [Longimicrobium terrae]NNC27728.1 glycosyltransferase family 4 protein [Longimicrobium terrae]